MGANNTKKLKNRIKSVSSTRHLTKAMEIVAASKLKNATARGLVGCSATLRITFNPSVVLPMEGRAANTNISPFFNPPVYSSIGAKPVGMPTSTSLFMMLISEPKLSKQARASLVVSSAIFRAVSSPKRET